MEQRLLTAVVQVLTRPQYISWDNVDATYLITGGLTGIGLAITR